MEAPYSPLSEVNKPDLKFTESGGVFFPLFLKDSPIWCRDKTGTNLEAGKLGKENFNVLLEYSHLFRILKQ